MRNALPTTPPWKNESVIVNLHNESGTGKQWVCYKKRDNLVQYFDGYFCSPPLEVMQYFGGTADDRYNYERKQPANTVICGHLCLEFLSSSDQ